MSLRPRSLRGFNVFALMHETGVFVAVLLARDGSEPDEALLLLCFVGFSVLSRENKVIHSCQNTITLLS